MWKFILFFSLISVCWSKKEMTKGFNPKFTITNRITFGIGLSGQSGFIEAMMLMEPTFHLADNIPFIWPDTWLTNGRNG